MKLSLLCVAALALLATSSADSSASTASSAESAAASAEATQEPCPQTCPSTHRPVCAESSWPRDIMWFTNSCFKRMCECWLGILMTVRDKSVCRQRQAQWDLCPLFPPIITPRAGRKLQERQGSSEEGYGPQ